MAGMTERDFPTRWRFHQDEALHVGHMPHAPSQHGPARRSIGCPDAVQRHGDPCNIAPHLGHCVLGMIVDADASVLVGLIALAFVGFEWVRIGLLDPTRVRRVQRIHLVEIVRSGMLARAPELHLWPPSCRPLLTPCAFCKHPAQKRSKPSSRKAPRLVCCILVSPRRHTEFKSVPYAMLLCMLPQT